MKNVMLIFEEKNEEYLEPVRPGRKYPRNKDKKNKYSINNNRFNYLIN